MNSTCFLPPGDHFNNFSNPTLLPLPCNHAVGSANLVTGKVEFSQYGYNQAAWAVYLFTALNGFAILAHVALGIYWRLWWTIPTLALGALTETIGWAGRIWSLKSTRWDTNYGGQWYSSENAFMMQIPCLVIAPTFFSAANYVLLNRLVRHTGSRFSSITPASFAIMFVGGDILCILIQGAGGGIAASGGEQAKAGADITTAGICLQLAITVLFGLFLAEFAYRFLVRRPARRQKDITLWLKFPGARRRSREAQAAYVSSLSSHETPGTPSPRGGADKEAYPSGHTYAPQHDKPKVLGMTAALALAALLIIARSVYRTVEFTDGWRGDVATDQTLFLALDALLMILLVYAYVFFHPGLALEPSRA